MKKKHVLLIDDNEMDNYISKYVISKSDMAEKITVISSAPMALAFLRTLRDDSAAFPDLIFLDIRMPQMDGFGFLEAFNKIAGTDTACDVVMLSSSSDQSDIDNALRHPFVKKFFTKPMTIEMIEILKSL